MRATSRFLLRFLLAAERAGATCPCLDDLAAAVADATGTKPEAPLRSWSRLRGQGFVTFLRGRGEPGFHGAPALTRAGRDYLRHRAAWWAKRDGPVEVPDEWRGPHVERVTRESLERLEEAPRGIPEDVAPLPERSRPAHRATEAEARALGGAALAGLEWAVRRMRGPGRLEPAPAETPRSFAPAGAVPAHLRCPCGADRRALTLVGHRQARCGRCWAILAW